MKTIDEIKEKLRKEIQFLKDVNKNREEFTDFYHNRLYGQQEAYETFLEWLEANK